MRSVFALLSTALLLMGCSTNDCCDPCAPRTQRACGQVDQSATRAPVGFTDLGNWALPAFPEKSTLGAEDPPVWEYQEKLGPQMTTPTRHNYQCPINIPNPDGCIKPCETWGYWCHTVTRINAVADPGWEFYQAAETIEVNCEGGACGWNEIGGTKRNKVRLVEYTRTRIEVDVYASSWGCKVQVRAFQRRPKKTP